MGEGLHRAEAEGGDTEGRWGRFLFSRSRDRLLERLRLSGVFLLFGGDTDLEDFRLFGGEMDLEDFRLLGGETDLDDFRLLGGGDTDLEAFLLFGGEIDLEDFLLLGGDTDLDDFRFREGETDLEDFRLFGGETDLEDFLFFGGETDLEDFLLLGGETDLGDFLLFGGETDLGDFICFLGGDAERFFSFSLSFERLRLLLLFFDRFLSAGERLLDLLTPLGSLGERLLRLFLCFSLLKVLRGGERLLLDRLRCFFRAGDLLLEREDFLFGDLDIAL